MGEFYNLWDNFFKVLPDIKKEMIAVANKNGLDIDAALLLIILNNYPEVKISAEENLINMLCNKGLCEYTEKGLAVTSRGAILAKSLSMALKKL